MHDLATIKAINKNPAAYRAAQEPQHGVDVEETRAAQEFHGKRVAARAAVNGTPFADQKPVEHLGQEGIHCAIDQAANTPFMKFWADLNTRKGEVGYRAAKIAYEGGPTPEGTITFAENGDGLRAVIAPPVNGARAYYGEYRKRWAEHHDQTLWVRVCNDQGQPIVYTYPDFALIAARRNRNELVPADQR